MYDAVADDYCYPGTTVLKNKLDLRDPEELHSFEAEVSDVRADEELPAGNLDFTHFKAVHEHLFQDVYDWAGRIRTVRMSKGGNPFCFPENIENQAKLLFAQLKKDKFLAGLEPEAFAEKGGPFLIRTQRHPRIPRRQRSHTAVVLPAAGGPSWASN
nr:Fic family protein [Bradyrhizobium agreste]